MDTANLEYYKTFYYVVRCGTITAAAQALNLTQPTVTNAIHRLEQQLDTTLFVRGKKGIQLTAEGQILWRRVEPAMTLLRSGEEELRQSQRLEGGSLRIVATELGCRSYLIPSLEQFTQDHPKVKLQFRNAASEEMLEMVRRGEADFALLHTPFPPCDDLTLRSLDQQEECFVVGPKYRFLVQDPLTLEAMVEYPMIALPENTSGQRVITALFAENHLPYQPNIEVSTIGLMIQAVEHGFGIGFLPAHVAESRIRSGKMYRVSTTAAPLRRRAYVITSKTLPLSPAAQVFLDDYLFQEQDETEHELG